jgi:hypothetical protein
LNTDHIADALHDQGGPSWDKTVFRLLTGVDVAGLAAGAPTAGTGTAVSLASSGWWLRNLDDVAARLAARSGVSVLAVFECLRPAISGWHIAHPDGTSERRVAGELGEWGAGVVRLTGAAPFTCERLAEVAHLVHGDDPKGADLPGLFNFTADSDQPDEWVNLLEVRGACLAEGLLWRPGQARDPTDEVPDTMRIVLLRSRVRLPGPPRWARAVRAAAIRTAEEAARSDGWLCLVPEQGENQDVYATAVRLLQLAPLADGSSMGVLHPRCAVRVGPVEEGAATIEVVVQEEGTAQADHKEVLGLVLDRLRTVHPELAFNEQELIDDPDPAVHIAWRLEFDPLTAQEYLATRHPAARLRVLADLLAR